MYLYQGNWEKYYENGVLESRGAYLHGLVNGVWEHYDEKGALLFKRHYVKGKLTVYPDVQPVKISKHSDSIALKTASNTNRSR